MIFVRVALPTPLPSLFDYQCDTQVAPGCRVRVPFGKRELVGIVMETTSHSDVPSHKLKTIIDVLDTTPLLSQKQLYFMLWASRYYHHPVGEVVFSSMPASYKTGKNPTPPKPLPSYIPKPASVTLNSEQKAAAEWFETQSDFKCALLEGITGSGKTEVYQEGISLLLNQGKQALLLIPEIALSQQTVERLQARFGERVLSFHSRMNEKERRHVWYHVQNSTPVVIVSTRSGLFLPFQNLGGIWVDEEHEPSYKQSEGFRYHGRDCAIFLAHHWRIPIVLGTATPSLSTLHHAKEGKYAHLLLTERCGNASLPTVTLIDAPENKTDQGLSLPLRRAIEDHLKKDQQVLLFLNRRGFAPALLCPECHWTAGCTRCSAKMAVHVNLNLLWCHHCDTKTAIPALCPTCKTPVKPVGLGIQRLEESLQKLFPEIPLIRIDSDSTKLKNSLSEKLAQIHSGQPAIIIGTQMIAKGHHFPKVTLVAILDVDGGLLSADYHATERMGQLITQVAGRAGRGTDPGMVLLQTQFQTHPLLQTLTQKGYAEFSQSLLAERAEAGLPPYKAMAIVYAEHKTSTLPFDFLNHLEVPALDIVGPLPSPLSKKADLYRAQVLIMASCRSQLQKGLASLSHRLQQHPLAKKLHWGIDVDPIDLS